LLVMSYSPAAARPGRMDLCGGCRPNPFNPAGNLRRGEVPDLKVDLSSDILPAPRLKPDASGNVFVEAYTDFKLHDICEPGEAEHLNMNQSQWSPKLMEGNCRFL